MELKEFREMLLGSITPSFVELLCNLAEEHGNDTPLPNVMVVVQTLLFGLYLQEYDVYLEFNNRSSDIHTCLRHPSGVDWFSKIKDGLSEEQKFTESDELNSILFLVDRHRVHAKLVIGILEQMLGVK